MLEYRWQRIMQPHDEKHSHISMLLAIVFAYLLLALPSPSSGTERTESSGTYANNLRKHARQLQIAEPPDLAKSTFYLADNGKDCSRDGRSWCTQSGASLHAVDCDDDGLLDLTCEDTWGRRWTLLSSLRCDVRESGNGLAPASSCPMVYGISSLPALQSPQPDPVLETVDTRFSSPVQLAAGVTSLPPTYPAPPWSPLSPKDHPDALQSPPPSNLSLSPPWRPPPPSHPSPPPQWLPLPPRPEQPPPRAPPLPKPSPPPPQIPQPPKPSPPSPQIPPSSIPSPPPPWTPPPPNPSQPPPRTPPPSKPSQPPPRTPPPSKPSQPPPRWTPPRPKSSTPPPRWTSPPLKPSTPPPRWTSPPPKPSTPPPRMPPTPKHSPPPPSVQSSSPPRNPPPKQQSPAAARPPPHSPRPPLAPPKAPLPPPKPPLAPRPPPSPRPPRPPRPLPPSPPNPLPPSPPWPPISLITRQATYGDYSFSEEGTNATLGIEMVPLPSVPDNNPSSYGQWVMKAVGNIVAVHMLLIPGTDKYFFMERPSGRHPDRSSNIVGYYDFNTNHFTNVIYTDSVFCAGHTVTQDGHILVVGGHIAKSGYSDGLKGVRIFSRKTLTMHRIANMTFPRWYPTATLLPNGKVTIMGGTVLPGSGTGANPIYEVWEPSNPGKLLLRQQSLGLIAHSNDIYYPFTYVLPTGDLFIFCNSYGEITEPMTGTVRTALPSWSSVATGIRTEYPNTGTSAMLPLTPKNGYTPEVVIFGGQNDKGWINTTASKLALRIKVVYDPNKKNYTFGEGWTAEKMPLPRVMGDAVVLPNGKVVVLNGAVKGLAGDSVAGGVAKANEPNLWPVLYDPAAPSGSRMHLMSRSMIPRLYHSTALLTTDGSILVAGCDRCDRYWWNTPGGISKSPTVFAEYRIEVFRPPYWFNQTAKPQIERMNNSTWDLEDGVNVMQYAQPFVLQYSMFYATDMVTSAVLVTPGSGTHSTNMNQRVVGLEIIFQDVNARSLVLRGPPDINIAPPGWYMLFLLNGEVYGQSKWVRLPGTAQRVDSVLTAASAVAS